MISTAYQFIKIFAISLFIFSANARAVDLFGYFEFDYGQKIKDGLTGSSSQSGDFDTAYLSIMLQHEIEIYKFFSEVELQHGAEFTGDKGGATSSTPNAAVVVERAYAEMHFHPKFNLVLGKSLSPTLWKANHYPNVVKTATEPMMVKKEVINGGYIGPMIYGNLGAGFSYNIWSNRSSNNSSLKANNNAFSKFARIAYDIPFTDGSASISYMAGNVEDEVSPTGPKARRNPMSVDLSVNYGKFLIWFESAKSDGDNGAQGSYAVASFAFDINKSEELSPYFLFDQFKESALTSAFVNYGFGLNYKPIPNLVHKLEYYQQKNDASLSADGFANGDQILKYQLVYFYN